MLSPYPADESCPVNEDAAMALRRIDAAIGRSDRRAAAVGDRPFEGHHIATYAAKSSGSRIRGFNTASTRSPAAQRYMASSAGRDRVLHEAK